MAGIDYDAVYREGGAPWEIGAVQPALTAVLEDFRGPRVLDLGCGTGELAVVLARRGFAVTGVDVSAPGIDLARARAARAGVRVDLRVADATRLELNRTFGSLVDCGLLHNLQRYDPPAAARYLALLPGLAEPGAALFVLGVSAAAGGDWRMTVDYLRAAFGEPVWTGRRIEQVEVAAVRDGEPFTMPGLLLRATRRAA